MLTFTVETPGDLQYERISGVSITVVTREGHAVAIATTDADGVATTRVAAGKYDAIASAVGYRSATIDVTAAPGEAAVRFILLPMPDPATRLPPPPPVPRGAISGRVLTLAGDPLADTSVTFIPDVWDSQVSTVTANDGTFRVAVPIGRPGGSNDFRAAIRGNARFPNEQESVFYKADTVELPSRIHVSAGSETTGVELRVPTHPEYFVTVMVRDLTGNVPPAVEISMSSVSKAVGETVREDHVGTRMAATDGTATFGPLRRGRVTFWAVSKGPRGYLAATTEVEVDDRGADAVLMQLLPAARLKGRVEFQGLPRILRGPSPLRVQEFVPEHPQRGYHENDPNGMVAMDGTVVLDGLAGGRCLAVEYIPDGWILQSITVGGQDVTNVPLVFEPGQEITDVVFRVTPGDRLRAAPRNCKN